jgi:cytochrome P450
MTTATAPTQATSLPPGPGGPQPLTAARFMLQPASFLDGAAARFGDSFTVRLSAERTVVITSDPATVKRVFTGDPDKLLAGVGNVILQPLLGPRSVLLLDGPEHMRQRRLMLPPFHGERMRAYGETMREIAERHVARWPRRSPFPAQRSMQAITLEVILRAVFGATDAREVARLAQPLRAVLDATASQRRLLLLQLTSSKDAGPRSPWGRFRKLIEPADAVIREQIAARRADAVEADDILSLLLAARDEDDRPLTDDELRDELMTLLLAGHETTATALSWTLERVVRHPAVLARLTEEARSEDSDGAYLDAVIKETLRLRPVIPGVVRYLTEPFEADGRLLPAGVHVAPSIYLLHRRPDLYPEPRAFRPERFLDRPAGTYEWIPFGGGIRRCLGASFALSEMNVVLGTILRDVDLKPAPAAKGERTSRRAITYVPARGARITIA